MAKTSNINRSKAKPKFKVRAHNRCKICGRPRGFIQMFGICRLCFRLLASTGKLPGVKKASF